MENILCGILNYGRTHKDMKKITLLDLQKKKAKGEVVTWITAYDLPFATAAEAAGIDIPSESRRRGGGYARRGNIRFSDPGSTGRTEDAGPDPRLA